MEHFVTLFNSLYLPQGLTLYKSLGRYVKSYTLWVLCIDEETYTLLSALDLENIRLIKLSDVETEELLRVKNERKLVEYLWTLTPFTPRFVFESDPNIKRVTYLDADMWFLKDPACIFKEFEASGKSVLITDHAYAPENDRSVEFGQYCVQFMIFEREGGEQVREWWERRCVEWCYSYAEDGKFGDQKYLDQWPDKFKDSVHVLESQHWMLAPWNATRFPYSTGIVFHFHGLRVLGDNKFSLSGYALPPNLIKHVYRVYLETLGQSVLELRKVGFVLRAQDKSPGILKSLNLLRLGIKFQLWRFRLNNTYSI